MRNPPRPQQGFHLPVHDHQTHAYTGSNCTTSVYRAGGATGRIVATVNRTFDGSGNCTAQALVLS